MRENGATKERLIEATGIPECYADGVASIEFNGPTARITYFAFRTVCSERVMVPVLEVVLPSEGVGANGVLEMIRRARLSGRAAIGEALGETAH